MSGHINADARAALGVRPGTRPGEPLPPTVPSSSRTRLYDPPVGYIETVPEQDPLSTEMLADTVPALTYSMPSAIPTGAPALPAGAAGSSFNQSFNQPFTQPSHARHISIDEPPKPKRPPQLRITTDFSSKTLESDTGSSKTSASPLVEPVRKPKRVPHHRKSSLGLAQSRGLLETQKMLNLLLDRLEARSAAPDVLDRAVIKARKEAGHITRRRRFGARLGEAAVAAVTAAQRKKIHVDDDGDDSDDVDDILILDEDDWDTDATTDLVEQMRDLLVLSERQVLDLFGASQIAAFDKRNATKDKRKSSRFSSMTASLSKVSSNDSHAGPGGEVSGPRLLQRLAAILRSLILIDCMYTTYRFRPLKPPYFLQSMCLDIAAVLYSKGDMKTKLHVFESVTDALYGWGHPMRERICEWLEGRLNELLVRLEEERSDGMEEDQSNIVFNDPFSPSTSSPPQVTADIPTFAFSVETDDADNPTVPKGKGWIEHSSPASSTGSRPWNRHLSGVLSTHSTAISPLALQISALVPRLLVAIASIDMNSARLTTLFRVHRLVSLVLNAKPDVGSDLLEIIAQGSADASQRAFDMLTTYFPLCTGHNTIARRPPLCTYLAQRMKWETGQERELGEDEMESHHYLPWRGSESGDDPCQTCERPCQGFCVRCTLCQDTKHVDCLLLYGDELVEWATTVVGGAGSKPTMPKHENVTVKYSKCVPRLDEKVHDGGPTQNGPEATIRTIGQHTFHLVNLFTLTLCGDCREPLWGTTKQAYVCLGQCQRFFHPACIEKMKDRGSTLCRPGAEAFVNTNDPDYKRDPFTTTAAAVQESFARAASEVYREPNRLAKLSFDETALLYAHLWIQHEIYMNGIRAGSIRYSGEALADPSTIPGTLALLEQYNQHLTERESQASAALQDYSRTTGESILDAKDLLWRPRYLEYCSALLKAPFDPSDNLSGSLLTPGQVGSFEPDPPTTAFEALGMTSVRHSMASDLNIKDRLAAAVLLERMRGFGLCAVPHCRKVGADEVQDSHLLVTFPIPLLLDSSPSVELLVLAIEQMLDVVDLTANEQAFNLLCNRAWPSPMCSAYALERLGGAVLSWVMDGDDVLHYVVKNYASKAKRPPGVRVARGPSRGTTAVATYKDDRARMFERYAKPWLEALHALDSSLYASLAYDRSKMTDNKYQVQQLSKGSSAASQIAGMALERMVTLADVGASFSIVLDLIVAWLEDLGAVSKLDVAYRSLPRLLQHANSQKGILGEDLWELARATSHEGPDGVKRVCQWLRVLSCSGAEVPWETVTDMVELVAGADVANEARLDLISTIHSNTTPTDSKAFAQLCNRQLVRLGGALSFRPTDLELQMLRTNLLSILRAYGTTAADIAETSLKVPEVKHPASNTTMRNKQQPTPPMSTPALIALDPSILHVVASLLRRKDYPAEVLLDFLWLLLMRAPAVENADGFLFQNCAILYEAIWPLYARDINRRSRSRVFLKLVMVNPSPIEEMVKRELEQVDQTSLRERMLTLVLELADDVVTADLECFRSNAVGLVMLFFTEVLQPLNPIPDILVIWKAIQPSQLIAIARCFEEHIVSCSDEEKKKFLAQLLQLRSLFPSWPVLNWYTIQQIINEQQAASIHFGNSDTPQAAAALEDARLIHATSLCLGLNMLAAGVPCEWSMLQEFQRCVAATCAPPWQHPKETVTGLLLPGLKNVLDSTARITVNNASHDDKDRKTITVGSLFVPIVVEFANDLEMEEVLVQRYILDILLVVYYKHNVQPVELQALSTLQTLATFAANRLQSIENRLLAVQILNTAENHMTKDRFSRVLPALFVLVADIIAKESSGGDSALVDASRGFLEASIESYGDAGLFLQVLKQDGQKSKGANSSEALGKALQIASREQVEDGSWRYTWIEKVVTDLPDIFKFPRAQINSVLLSFSRLVGTLNQNLAPHVATHYGVFLTRLTKHVAEYDHFSDFDPDPVLHASCILLQRTRSSEQSQLLNHIAPFLNLSVQRYSVSFESIAELVPVCTEVSTRLKHQNIISNILYELVITAVNGMSVTATSLSSLLKFLTMGLQDNEAERKERLPRLLEASLGCAHVLQRAHPTIAHGRGDVNSTLQLLSSAATVLVLAELEAPGNIGKVLGQMPKEAASVQLDIFAHLLFSSLSLNLGRDRSNIAALFPIAARATALSLFGAGDLLTVHDPNGDGAHLASIVFIVARLVLLSGIPQADEEIASFETLELFWRRVWPEWERVLALSLRDTCVNSPLRAVLHSVLLDMVIFVGSMRPTLLIEPAGAIVRGLRSLEEWQSNTGINNSSSKLPKAIKAIETAQLSYDADTDRPKRSTTIKQVWNDMLATEKIVSLRAEAEREREKQKHAYKTLARGV